MKLFDPVGLDLSLTSTGVAVGDATVAVSVTATGAERLALLRDRILDFVRSVEQPFVLVEGYSFASRNSQAHALGELGGVVRVSLWEQGIPYVEVPPTVRAKFACGRGNASKAEVISAVSARTGIAWDGKGADDQCDAWILQEIGFVHQGNARFSWPASHCEALEKMRWPS